MCVPVCDIYRRILSHNFHRMLIKYTGVNTTNCYDYSDSDAIAIK